MYVHDPCRVSDNESMAYGTTIDEAHTARKMTEHRQREKSRRKFFLSGDDRAITTGSF